MTGLSRLIGVWGVVMALAVGPVAAQQFDNFGEETPLLDGFDFGTLPDDGSVVPSLGDDGVLPDGPDIQLDILNGDDSALEEDDTGLFLFPGTGTPVTSVSQPATEQASRVTLRALDKTLGRPTDVDMGVGETVMFGRIAIQLLDCRYPVDDPSSDAFAHLQIFDLDGNSLFDGWMVASSPALNALEHPRYDVWVLRCAET